MADREPWWKRTTVYQIYPRSFADSNGDGVGDLPGIIEKLDYLAWLGVETLWLSPFFESPQEDFGYDITNHRAVDPSAGTLDDFRRLVHEVHARGMRIVLDMVLNHTSRAHPWFVASRASRTNDESDHYIWRRGRGPFGRRPPNNWNSMLGGSGWHRDARRGDWYFASFLPFQPDLNWRNPAVKRAMLDVLRFWLDEGVDGFRLDIFNALFKDAAFADNPFSTRAIPSEDDPNGFFQRNLHTIDHADTFAFARELRALVDAAPGSERFMVGEVFGSLETLRRYAEGGDGLHLVFLFQTLRVPFDARRLRALIRDIDDAFAMPRWPTWVFGNHDRPRLMDRLGGDVTRAKLFAVLALTVRAVPFIYYGDEIGMRSIDIPKKRALDPISARYGFVPDVVRRWLKPRGILMNRDECRLPMPWRGGDGAGFTAPGVQPWLPFPPDATRRHVAAQREDPHSLLACYRSVLHLRRAQPALQAGTLEVLDSPSLPGDVVAYRRRLEGHPAVDVYLHLGDRPAGVELRPGHPPGTAARVFSTHRSTISPAPPAWDLAPCEALIVFDDAPATPDGS